MHPVDKIESYDITGNGFPKKVEQVVRACHMNYLMYIDRLMHKEHMVRVYVSQKSSWRPTWWERSKGRSGLSEHTYGFLGATDITCDLFTKNKHLLLEYLIKHTSYTRFAVYDGFIHADYKNEYDDAYAYKVVNGRWYRDYKIERVLV